ncbi:MAG: 23S rRNA (uracil(1939)-C(5))-methyltransferase RlmD [Intestinibacter bartlettii]|nr:23S rRNA (uracil(1939)-C(5))-methyltransferase RlmD [Intestinibacter bartlettii]
MMNIQKNQEYIVEIIDNGYEGEGIAKIDNFTIFIPGAIKGEKIKILIVKVLSSHAFGKILEIIKKSEKRKEVDCLTYKRCGGCNLRHIEYEETLKIKQDVVQNLVNKILKNKIRVQETVGMKNPFHYRNKAQYPLGINNKGEPIIGVFANRTHEVIPIEKCLIQNPQSEQIAKYILNFIKENKISIYNENTRKGLFRHIVIKIGIRTGQIMCILVVNGENILKEEQLINELITKFPQIKTIVKNVNMKNTNVILGQRNINVYGNGYIEDILGKYTFKISPLSFYQVNPIQAEKLYNLGVEMAQISKDDTVFDLYCGIGTISLFMAKYAKKVYGIEIVKEAIDAAKENAKINNVDNTEFYAGDVEVVLDELINKNKVKADIVMFDPPRKGLDKKSINNILQIKPKKLVYISCNPATLIRDLKMFEEQYEIKTIIPVDMFPWTSHIECVSLLCLKKGLS